MAGTPENQNFIVGGDDPAVALLPDEARGARGAHANAGKANFGLATFDPDFTEHIMDGSQGLIYVTQDSTAFVWRNFFNSREHDPREHQRGYLQGRPRGPAPPPRSRRCSWASVPTAAPHLGVSHGLHRPGHQSGGERRRLNAPISHIFGTHCRDYIKSRLMRNGKRVPG